MTADNKAAVAAAALGLLSTDEEQRDKHDIESDSVVMGIAIIAGIFPSLPVIQSPCKET